MAPKKNKGQKMGIGDFLQDASLGTTSWADEMEDAPLPSAPFGGSKYGTGDRTYGSGKESGGSNAFTDRGYSMRPQVALPDKPPYTVHLGNLSFDATEGDVHDFFDDCDVDNVRIVEDKLEAKPKGFGYVEFKTRTGIEKALSKDGTQFQGRNIRISPAEPQKDRAGTRDISDWSRKGPLPDLPRQESRRGMDRPERSDRGGFDLGDPRGQRFENSSDAGGDRSNRRGYEPSENRSRDLGNWERKGPATPTLPNGPPARSFERPSSRDGPSLRRNSPAWGEGQSQDSGSRPPRREFSDRPQVERAPTAAEQDNQWRARMKPDAPPAPPTPTATAARSPALSHRELSTPPSPAGAPPGPASRPKLNLAKRTVSEATSDSPTPALPSDAKSSPFGAARPVDTATKEKEVEEKRQQVLKEKREADELAQKEKKLADEKAREEKKQARDAELAARMAKGDSEPRGPAQTNGEKANNSKREKPASSKDRAEKENGATPPVAGKQYEILRRHADEEASAADEDVNGEDLNDIVTGDKETKPQDIITNVQKDDQATGADATADALEDDGWNVVSKPARKGKSGAQSSRALAS